MRILAWGQNSRWVLDSMHWLNISYFLSWSLFEILHVPRCANQGFNYSTRHPTLCMIPDYALIRIDNTLGHLNNPEISHEIVGIGATSCLILFSKVIQIIFCHIPCPFSHLCMKLEGDIWMHKGTDGTKAHIIMGAMHASLDFFLNVHTCTLLGIAFLSSTRLLVRI